MPSLRIIVDENIPLAREVFSRFGKVVTLPGSAITREEIRNTDILIVRSVTRVDEHLLDGSRVRFVGSATVGVDHIETDTLHQRGIAFAHAPGSNADSVVEYVISALLLLSCRLNYKLENRLVGIVGCGKIGSRLAERLKALGMAVIKNDPPLARKAESQGLSHDYRRLDEVLAQTEIVSIHVPLIEDGIDRTLHLFDRKRLDSMNSQAWLINTARGAVVDNDALAEVLHAFPGKPIRLVFDLVYGHAARSSQGR